jgi:pimeloyl-ACP methyl ester carboxylesterase
MNIPAQALVALLLATPVCLASAAPRPPADDAVQGRGAVSSIQVGSLALTRCGLAYCGSVTRPLDPAQAVPGSVTINFEYYPPTNPALPVAGALVATEGGPGFATTGSRGSYLGLLQPLMANRSLLLVNNRGTGNSGAINCPALQQDPLYRNSTIAACGLQLGATADLYATGMAADDLSAVISALQLGPVDLYGDSYGSFFSQAFAARHPTQLRSVVLDGAYAVIGFDPWYPEGAAQAQLAFNNACARSPACAAQPGASMDRIGALLGSLRAVPVSGSAPDGNGTLQSVTANASGLAYAMLGNATGPVIYRDLDAASRAWLAGDQAPLLRLIAENQTAAFSSNGAPLASAFSAGLFVSVSCSDYPQVYDVTLPLAARQAAAQAAIAAKQDSDPDVYAPFTIAELLAVPQDYSVVNLCLTWPVPSAAHPPAQPVPPGTAFPATPVLVLNGDLDSLTPPAQGAQATALFPNARQIVVPNSFHVTALGDAYHCASAIVRQFIQTLSPGDTSCTAQIPEVRLVPMFATRTSQLAPATAAAGNQGTTQDLQTVAAALLTAGDALARYGINFSGNDVGLRGGSFSNTTQQGTATLQLNRLKWTADLAVSGSIVWPWASGAVTASLTLPQGTLQAQWSALQPLATATVTGTLNGRRIAATMYAPF